MFYRLISFDEFQTFETVLKLPDSLYHLAFQLFDVSCNGQIEFGQYKYLLLLVFVCEPYLLKSLLFAMLIFACGFEKIIDV